MTELEKKHPSLPVYLYHQRSGIYQAILDLLNEAGERTIDKQVIIRAMALYGMREGLPAFQTWWNAMGSGTNDVILPIVETDTGTDRKQIRLYPREEHAPLVMLYRRLPDGPPHQVLMRTVLAYGMMSSEFATFLQGMGLDVEEYLPSFPVAA